MSAQFWLNLQSAYDLRVAEQAAGGDIVRLPTREQGIIRSAPRRAEGVARISLTLNPGYALST